MRSILIRVVGSALLLALPALPLHAQRALRFGGAVSHLSPRDAMPAGAGYTASVGWLANSTSETAAFLTRWVGTGLGTPNEDLTAFGVESRYFPVEASGVAPFITTGIGAYRYTTPGGLLTQPATEWGFTSLMGLGLGTTLGDHAWLGAEGRLRMDNGLRSTEYRLQGVYALGPVRVATSTPGGVAPFAVGVARLGHGPYTARSPYAGIRFRRDKGAHASIAVEAGAAGLTSDETGTAERATAWIVQPAAEYGWRTRWGRPFLEIGPQLLGFVGGPDDGMLVGIHTGGGADIHLSPALDLTLLTRVTWFQTGAGRHQFGLQLGTAVGVR